MQNSWKPEICISYGYKQSYVLYYTMTPCIQKVFIATHICIWSTMYNHYANSHICCLWLEKEPYLIFGNKGKLVAWTLHRFYVLKLTHPLLYDDDTITHAANDI